MKLKTHKKQRKHNTPAEKTKRGLAEILAYQQGKITLHTETFEVPEPPKTYKAPDIKRIRARGKYSQGIFAKVLNVSTKTVQSWESGERIPSHAALRLLEIVDKGIYRPDLSPR